VARQCALREYHKLWHLSEQEEKIEEIRPREKPKIKKAKENFRKNESYFGAWKMNSDTPATVVQYTKKVNKSRKIFWGVVIASWKRRVSM
jgi:hypothetical protein